MNRKELFKKWSQERIDSFLAAERRGNIEEVPGGWILRGQFYEKLPFSGKVLDSYLHFLASE